MALSNFKSSFPEYNYYIGPDVPTTEKLDGFKSFLLKFKDDCNFSITSFEPRQTIRGVQCTAFSTSSNYVAKIYVVLNTNREINLKEREAIDKMWVNTLELSLTLEDKWNGENYTVYKRLTLNGKKRLLEQFVDKYRDSQFDINPLFGGGTTFRIVATDKAGEHEMLIDYLPQRQGEAAELEKVLKPPEAQLVDDAPGDDVLEGDSEPTDEEELGEATIPVATANLHPALQRAIKLRFAHGYYDDAILKACIALENAIQDKSNLPTSLTGTALISKVFPKDNPLITLANDQGEREGYGFLYRGLLQAIRNHFAHNLTELSDPDRTLEWLSFISALFYKLDEGIVAPPTTTP